ncbi:MoaD/ThiS family protein [bacterium]|nr:MoaD/ThiS family protein [Mariniblastus sp.]MDB4379984.1 MoaD/ThiS family protein [Mariniblastus sp.]MDB4399770.1 MoaD/ThiS family protein [bacterium]
MKIQIKLFAAAREISDRGEIELEVADDISVGDLKKFVSREYPKMKDLILRSAVSLNREFSTDECVVHVNDEIALIPPVSGG